MNLANFHNHSEFSFLGSLLRVENLVSFAAFYGYPACVLTDTLSTWGFYRLEKLCREQKIRPVYGLELFVRGINGRGHYPVRIVALDNKGLSHLFQLNTESHAVFRRNGRYALPLERFRECGEGLAVLAEGEILHRLATPGQETDAIEVANRYMEAFPGRFYIDVNYAGESKLPLLRSLSAFADEKGIPAVASAETRYFSEDRNAFACLEQFRRKSWPHDERGYSVDLEMDYAIRRPVELSGLFRNHPAYLDNIRLLLERADARLEVKSVAISRPQPEGKRLWQICLYRWKELGLGRDYKLRLQYELSLIEKGGFTGYFQMLADLASWLRKKRVPVTSGRGSCGYSLVLYLLGLSGIDPIRYGFRFEWFFSPLPDAVPEVEIDLCWRKRDFVLAHLQDKIGRERICRVSSYDRLLARSVIREFGKIYRLSRSSMTRLLGAIGGVSGMTLSEMRQNDPRLDALLQEDHEAAAFFDMALKIEGAPVRGSVHPGKLLYAQEGIGTFASMEFPKEGGVALEMTSEDAGIAGFPSLELVAQRFVSVIADAERMARLPDSGDTDTETWESLASGEASSIMQLEQPVCRDLLKKISPHILEELADVLALARNVSMRSGITGEYIRRKSENFSGDWKGTVAEILHPTYGLLQYDVQIYRISSEVGGLSRENSAVLAGALRNRDHSVVTDLRKSFIEGCEGNGMDTGDASRLFALLADFGPYAANRSGCLAGAMNAFRAARLKKHLPLEFAMANLNNQFGNQSRLNRILGEIRIESKRTGIGVLPVCVNRSGIMFTREKGSLRAGLLLVHHVGMDLSREIVEQRKRNGEFRDFPDFLERMFGSGIGMRSVEMLVKAGAFDCFGLEREVLLEVLPKAMRIIRKEGGGQPALFAEETPRSRFAELISGIRIRAGEERFRTYPGMEMESMGVFLAYHPLDRYMETLRGMERTVLADLETVDSGTFAGYLHPYRVIRTRQGNLMASARITDETGGAVCLFFPAVYQRFSRILGEGKIAVVKGKISDGKILAEMVYLLDEETGLEDREALA
jgi:DNA polymerase-3 subunit alpha